MWAGESQMLLRVLAGLLIAAPVLLAQSGPDRVEVPPSTDAGLIALSDEGWAYVPATAAHERAQVVVLLHGAGGTARRMIDRFRRVADAEGVVLVAAKSAGRTWGLIEAMAQSHGHGLYRFVGGDSARVERALAELRRSEGIAPERVVLAGFSDGASFALSLGPAQPRLY